VLQTEGSPEQDQPDSTTHVSEHPSPGLAFPSSQVSDPAIIESPQVVLQTDGSPEQE
jgi:hypothetical protein